MSTRRLAIFLDGTWNDSASNTNVLQLHERIAASDPAGVRQFAYYDSGVGTRKFEKIRGGAVGMGLSNNVRDAYSWLVKHYVDGDEVYVFGFSRGAYTARSLGGLIAGCGLAASNAPFGVDYLYERYQQRKDTAVPIYKLEFIRNVSRERDLTEEELTLLNHSRRIKIRMMGVWDTVGALGVPWTGMPLIGRDKFYFHNPNLSTIYENAYQALAVDEHRGAYKPTLWTLYKPDTPDGQPPPPPDMPSREKVEQRWFIGAHSNIGGGYPNDPLSGIPGAWLQAKAQKLGLHFSSSLNPARDAYKTQPVDSYAKFLWRGYQLLTLGRRYHRPIGIPVNKVKTGWSFPVNEYIDASVFQRFAEVESYRPRNLLHWSERTGRPLGTRLGDQPAC